MEEKVSGIVLSAISYGESDKILKVFTLEKGLISAKIKGVKKAGAKLKFASEPFCFAEFILLSGRAGYTVINASLIESFYAIRENIFKFYAGGAVLEFVKKFYKESMVAESAFIIALDALKSITFGNDFSASLARFLILSLKEVGYALNLDGCCECFSLTSPRIFFDYEKGAFYCENCFKGEGREINPDTFTALYRLEKGEEVSSSQSLRALRLIDYYLQNKTEESLFSLKEMLKIMA